MQLYQRKPLLTTWVRFLEAGQLDCCPAISVKAIKVRYKLQRAYGNKVNDGKPGRSRPDNGSWYDSMSRSDRKLSPLKNSSRGRLSGDTTTQHTCITQSTVPAGQLYCIKSLGTAYIFHNKIVPYTWVSMIIYQNSTICTHLLWPRPLDGGIKRWCCLMSVCLSRTSEITWEQRGPGKPKLAHR